MEKDSYIRFRMSSSDEELVKRAAVKLGRTVSEFIREQAVMNAKIILAYRSGQEEEVIRSFSSSGIMVASELKERANMFVPKSEE